MLSSAAPRVALSATGIRRESAEGAVKAEFPRLDGWELEQQIYRGEECSIFAARPDNGAGSMAADYAVKVLHDGAAPHRLDQFRREAWIGQQVQHVHLVPVFTARCGAKPRYLVMPLLRGVSGKEVLEASPCMPLGRALWVARQTAEGLVALHDFGWIHGDVKPANIMLSREGHATLIDLGFARKQQQHKAPDGPLAGSIAYASPQLFNGDPLTAAADVYSLAVTLFQMIAGRLPFDGVTAAELANAHLRHTPLDIREIDPLVPQEIAWMLRRAMAKVPIRRPSALEMRDTLATSEIRVLSQWHRTQGSPEAA